MKLPNKGQEELVRINLPCTFTLFKDAHLSAKLNCRPSSTSKTAARESTTHNRVVHACKQQENGAKLAS